MRRISVLARIAAAGTAVVGAVLAVGCPSAPPLAPPAAPLTPPTSLCVELNPAEPCNRAEEIEAWLRDPRLRIVGSAPTPGGRQGAKLLTLSVEGGGDGGGATVLRAKWRPLSSESLTNDPRKELGAYAVEKLFLEPHEYVVPPTAGRCFALEEYRKTVDSKAEPSFPEQGVDCVFGILSYWLENAAEPDDAHEEGLWPDNELLNEKLFEKDAAYRQAIADLNLLTVLIRHADAHDKQFLVGKNPRKPHVYTVDNTIAFQSVKNPMLIFREDWSYIQVPAVSARSIQRLQRLSADDWTQLRVIEQYEKRGNKLVPVAPTGIIGAPDAGLRWVGLGLQIGLTEGEIEGVQARLANLIKDVESGELPTF